MDAALVLSLAAAQGASLETAFKSAGFTTLLTRRDLSDPIAAVLKLNDGHGNRVDLQIGLRGLEREAFTRTVEIPFQGEALRFIGKEDFIAMKIFAGGPQDVLDARRAIQANRDTLDTALIRRLAGKYARDTTAAPASLLGE